MSAHPRYDVRFYAVGAPRTLGDVAKALGAVLRPSDKADRLIVGVAPLDDAGHGELTFAAGSNALRRACASKAAACLVAGVPEGADGAENPGEDGPAWLIVPDPKAAFIDAAALFVREHAPVAGVHPRAVVAENVLLGEGVIIAAGAVIEAGADIGAGSSIGPGAVIARGVVLGENCLIGPNAVISHAILGSRVRIGANAAIGGPGFGFAGGLGGHRRTPQIGRVLIGDDVEIGSCTTVDRGALGDTVIERGVKIDNLVQVAHNCRIGEHAILVGQVGLSGSCDVGPFAVLGGQAGVADHVRIGAGAQVGARSGVMRDVDPGAKMLGAPAKAAYAFFREIAVLQRLAKTDKARDRKS